MNRVRELRLKRLWTQVDLAAEAGISLRTISSIENGHLCSLSTKRSILEAFDVEPADADLVFPPTDDEDDE